MYKRILESELKKAIDYYPILTITGPRQSGKTTLVKQVFAEYEYFNLEDPNVLEQVKFDPKAFLVARKKGTIIDEIQNFPTLLSHIQVIVDDKNNTNKFVLTGSHQFALLEAINQSLAGRTDLLVLYPLSLSEIMPYCKQFDVDDYIFNGFYPRIYAENIPPSRHSKNYIKTYVERDVRKIINIKDLSLFQKFIKLCANRIGQPLNINSLCNEVGISNSTIKSWLSLLEASHIIYLLQPYYKNLGKRIIKSPKLYFIDVGLVCYLLGINEKKHLENHPLRGNLYENMIVMDLIKNRTNRGLEPNFYFYRDNNQNEVDLIFENNNELIPIEIKSSTTFNAQFLKGIKYFMKITSSVERGFLIYTGDPVVMESQIKILNYQSVERIFERE